MKNKIKNFMNKNNFYKTVHHLKNGNFGFILNKAKQKIKDDLLPDSQKKSVRPDDLFTFMFTQNNKRDKAYKPFIDHNVVNDTIRTIAFYLPQFHPIKENDENWGKGFTEWTNVSKAIPQFYGHYQPKLPGELGFYDLRLKEIQHRQIELAKNYGIDGFCFHFYWFNGKRVLEKPLEDFVADKTHNFSFCINWANENWTRRWDGLESDILLEQHYSDEDDIDFIRTVSELFHDPRYIRVDGKPLLMIYRVSLFPDIQSTVQRWRNYCRENGIGEIYLVLTHSFEHTNPEEIGFDAAVEFSPNTFSVPVQNNKQTFYNQNYNGMVFDYDDAINYSLSLKKPEYKKFKTLFPSWDNEARKPGKGTSFINSTPNKYETWLKKIYKYTKENFSEKEQLVFINAWNEWAEGAYLEPDKKFGYAYLEATYNAKAFYKKQREKIIVVSHDAYLHGAQYLALNIAKKFLDEHSYEVTILLNGTGPLINEFEKVGEVYRLFDMDEKSKQKLYQELSDSGIKYAIANTSTVGEVVRDLKNANISSISLVHEMENVILQYNLQKSLELIAKYADKVLFPSKVVERDFKKFVTLSPEKSLIQPQGLFRENRYKDKKELARKKLREVLFLPEDAFIVLNIAYGDERKGMDIFVRTGLNVLSKGYKVHFVWGGHYDASLYTKVQKMIDKTPYKEFFHFTGFLKEIDYFYAGSDLFYLSSREDPFPSVVMDAMNVALPVIGFKEAGGFSELLENGQGVLIDYLDIRQAANAIIDLLADKERYQKISQNASSRIEQDYDFSSYVQKLIALTQVKYLKVSVIIPNYNYEAYIEQRIRSVISQSYPIYEIVFLDDNSSDQSVQIAEKLLASSEISYKIIKNENNSGSVFRQWARGIAEAQGDYIWIAEADDLSEASFLEKVIQGFGHNGTVLSYSQSKMIDKDGRVMASDYLKYTNDIDKEKWKKNYNIEGSEELATSMCIKNVIPNVSAVVFKKMDIQNILDDLLQFKVAGDWFFYAWLLQKGRVSFISESLNMHRRHNESVTGNLDRQRHFDEIVQMQEYIESIADVSDEVRKKVLRYRQNVKKQLGIK